MSQYISSEKRAKIISAIKDEGMCIIDAAKTFLTTEATIKKLMEKQNRNDHSLSTELQKLKQENQELKAIIIEMARQSKRGK